LRGWTIGLALAMAAGIVAGVVIGSIPPVLIPIMALFANYTGWTAKVITIALGCVWPILLNTVDGVRSVDEVLRDTARSYRLGRLATLHHVILRGSSPRIATGARQALSIWVVYLGERVFVLSNRPTEVLADVPIDLPAERSQLVTRSSVRFTELRGQVYELVQQAKKGSAYDGVTQEGLRED
jgi:hypothetical protein